MHYENILMNTKYLWVLYHKNLILIFIYIIEKFLLDNSEQFSVAIALYLHVAILFGLQTVEWRDIPPGVGAFKYACSVLGQQLSCFSKSTLYTTATYVDWFTTYSWTFYKEISLWFTVRIDFRTMMIWYHFGISWLKLFS